MRLRQRFYLSLTHCGLHIWVCSRSLGARSYCKDRYLVTLRPSLKNTEKLGVCCRPGSRHDRQAASDTADICCCDRRRLLLRQDICLLLRQDRCLLLRHRSCLNSRHLSCLNTRRLCWLSGRCHQPTEKYLL